MCLADGLEDVEIQWPTVWEKTLLHLKVSLGPVLCQLNLYRYNAALQPAAWWPPLFRAEGE